MGPWLRSMDGLEGLAAREVLNRVPEEQPAPRAIQAAENKGTASVLYVRTLP